MTSQRQRGNIDRTIDKSAMTDGDMMTGLYAGASVQDFQGRDENLDHTHADASGFLDYVGQFDSVDFHARDANVKEWRYDRDFDTFNGLGMDSVRTFYHSGHGVMDTDGTFRARLGAKWNGRTSARSTRMAFADSTLRYLFLSACNSVRVLHGHNPHRTWNGANLGARMIFGFESTSIDWEGYGSNFFSHWNTGVSFSQAWQDASQGLTNDQIVSSTACGATAEEAQKRLWGERLFSRGAVSDDWYWWRWAGISTDVEVGVQLGIPIPHSPWHFETVRRSELQSVAELAERFGVQPSLSTDIDPAGDDSGVVVDDPRLVLIPNGSVSIVLAIPDPGTGLASTGTVRAAADDAVRTLDPEDRYGLVFDRLTSTYHGGADPGGELSEPDVADFTAHYRQVVEGTPIVVGGDGHVKVTLDRAGQLCRLIDRTVEIANVREASPGGVGDVDVLDILDGAAAPLGRFPGAVLSFDPNADEVGYRFGGHDGFLVARRVVTVTAGDATKDHLIEVPLF